MDKSETCSTRKRKRENPNSQVDEEGVDKSEALLPEKWENFISKVLENFEHSGGLGGVMSGLEFSNVSEISTQRMLAMSGIMEALTDVGTIIIGVYNETQTGEMADLVEKVSRRANRDKLFDKVVKASVTRKPDLKRIQGELADELGLTMKEKSKAKRAGILRDRIKMEQKILVILQDLTKGLDLGKIGIPFGEDHRGCKILLTSTSAEILSNQMQAHKVFMA